MPYRHVKLAHVMVIILLFGIGLAALRNPSQPWVSGLFTTAVILPLASVLKAIASPRDERLPWIGLALFGLVFLSLGFNLPQTDFASAGGTPPPDSFPAQVLWSLGPQINADVARSVAQESMSAARFGGAAASQNRVAAYRNCVSSLNVLGFSWVGYVLGHLMAGTCRED